MAAWFPGAYALRALSWAHLRVRGAAGRGWHTPVWLGIARFARSSYVNRALFGISTSGGPMAALMAVHALRALSWVHMRVWGAAGSCHTPPQRSISQYPIPYPILSISQHLTKTRLASSPRRVFSPLKFDPSKTA
jgi:hypothetical protein